MPTAAEIVQKYGGSKKQGASPSVKAAPIKGVSASDIVKKYKGMQAGPSRVPVQETQKYKDVVSKAKEASDKAMKANSTSGMAWNALKASPRAALDVLVGTPAKFVASALEAPGVAYNKQYTDRTYKVPGLTPFKSFQSDYGDVEKQVIEGNKGLGSAAWELAKVPLAGLETAGLISGVGKAVKGFRGPNQISQVLPGKSSPIQQKLAGSTQKLPSRQLDLRATATVEKSSQTPRTALEKTISSVTGKQKPLGGSSKAATYASKNRGFIDTVKSSSMSEAPVKRAVSGTYTPRETDALVKNVNELISKDINKAKDLALGGTNDESVATAMELIKHYQNKGDYDSAVQIADDVAVKLTEAGRSVQAASIYNRLTPEGILRYAQRELNAANKANPKLGLKLTGEQGKELTELAKKAQSATGEAQAIATQRMLDRVQELIPTPNFQKFATFWKAGLLTNPSTQVANLTGNTSMLGLENLKDIPATFFDKVLPGPRTKALPNLGAQAEGFGQGISKAGQFIRTGIDPDNVLAKVDYKKVNFTNPVIKGYTDTVFRSLGAGDKVFRQTLLKKSLAELAKVDGLNKGLKGEALMNHIDDLFQNPTNEMLDVATKDAMYGTFTSPNKLSEFISRGKQALGAYRPIADFVMPFTQTPTNVAARIADYSPIGFGKAAVQAMSGAGKRNVVESLGRATVGTGIAGIGYGLGKEGNMSGTMPTNETERNLWELQGKQPNSIKVGGRWLNLDKISPVGNVLGMGANYAQSGKALETAGQTLKGLKDMTFLKGMSSAMDAIGDPKRYADSYVENQAASLIPSLLAAAARQTDPVKRETNGWQEAVMNRIPGLKDNLMPKYDALGGEMQYEGNQFFNPFRPSTDKMNPVVDEIERLRSMGAELSLTKPDSDISVKGVQIQLTPEELNILQRDSGGLIQKTLEKIIRSNDYQTAEPTDQVKIIKSIIDKSREITGYKVVGKDKVIDGIKEYLENKTLKPFYTP